VLSYGIGAVAPIDRLIDRHGADRAGPVVFAGLFSVYGAPALASASGVALTVLCLFWGAASQLGLNILVGKPTALSRDRRGAILDLKSATTCAAVFARTASLGPIFTA
jgi:hypothetical protein